jgi:murein DD-endopeptidase MepM/ murein hydrolase activator NlpD
MTMLDIDLEVNRMSKFWRLRNNARRKPQPWQWPLARLGNRDPIVTLEHMTETRRGVDVGYIARASDSALFVPVHAAQAGEVVSALDVPTGYAISIDHGDRTTMTHYAHLSKMFVTPCIAKVVRRQFVHAGQVIGYAAKSPLHIRFELWQWDEGDGYVPIDAVPELARWTKPLTSVDVRHLVSEAA